MTSYVSNRLIYLNYKYGPLAMSAMFLLFLGDMLRKGSDNYAAMIVWLMMAVIFFVLFLMIRPYMVEVEISIKNIIVTSTKQTVEWREVTYLDFKWYGLYRMETADEVFVFAPYELGLSLFGYRVSIDDFDALIDRKKRELKL